MKRHGYNDRNMRSYGKGFTIDGIVYEKQNTANYNKESYDQCSDNVNSKVTP